MEKYLNEQINIKDWGTAFLLKEKLFIEYNEKKNCFNKEFLLKEQLKIKVNNFQKTLIQKLSIKEMKSISFNKERILREKLSIGSKEKTLELVEGVFIKSEEEKRQDKEKSLFLDLSILTTEKKEFNLYEKMFVFNNSTNAANEKELKEIIMLKKKEDLELNLELDIKMNSRDEFYLRKERSLIEKINLDYSFGDEKSFIIEESITFNEAGVENGEVVIEDLEEVGEDLGWLKTKLGTNINVPFLWNSNEESINIVFKFMEELNPLVDTVKIYATNMSDGSQIPLNVSQGIILQDGIVAWSTNNFSTKPLFPSDILITAYSIFNNTKKYNSILQCKKSSSGIDASLIEKLNSIEKKVSSVMPIFTFYVDEKNLEVVWKTLEPVLDTDEIVVTAINVNVGSNMGLKSGRGKRVSENIISWSTSDFWVRPNAPINILMEARIINKNESYFIMVQYKSRAIQSNASSSDKLFGKIIWA